MTTTRNASLSDAALARMFASGVAVPDDHPIGLPVGFSYRGPRGEFDEAQLEVLRRVSEAPEQLIPRLERIANGDE
jgi:hypothetical protein